LLYLPFNHVHAPNFASTAFCGTSTRGPVGDSTQELDHYIGVISDGVAAAGLDEDVVYFFTSDNGAPIGNDQHGNGPLRDGKMTTWEGGVREPAFVRWKGTFAPRVTDTLAATYDIFATVLALSGGTAPTGVVLDGKDLTPVLKDSTAASAHPCLIHYWSPQISNSGGPGGNGNTSGVGAVRCGQYKLHYYVRNTGAGGNHAKTSLKAGVQSPPALFDLDADMSESVVLDYRTDPKLQAVVAGIHAALQAHLATVQLVPNQMIAGKSCQGTAAPSCVGGDDLAVSVCSAPDSKSKYPHEANCSLTPQYYGTAQCRAANSSPKAFCLAKCMP
jgi:arylsulfatase A